MRFTFLLITFIPCLVNAQVILKSYSDAVELAKKNNRDIQISQERIAIEQSQKRVTNASLLPQVKAVSNLDYNYALPVQLIPAEFLGGKSGEYKKVQFGTKYNWTAGLEASIPVLNAAFWTDSKIAGINTEAVEANSQNVELEVMKQVARGYYITLLAADAVKISEQNLHTADSLKQIADHKFRNGLLEPLDYNRILSSWLRAKSDLERNKTILKNNYNALKYNLGVSQEDSLILAENLKEIPPSADLTANQDNYPSVKERKLLAQSSLLSVRREKYRRLPEISLYGRYQAQAQRNEFNFLNSDYPWYNIGVVGLRFEMPLFTGFGRTANIQRLSHRYDLQKKELNKEIERVKTEDQELVNNYNMNYQNTINMTASYKLSKENTDIALFKYTQGAYSLDQYLNVFNESLSIQNQYLNALSELYISKTIIELKNNLQ